MRLATGMTPDKSKSDVEKPGIVRFRGARAPYRPALHFDIRRLRAIVVIGLVVTFWGAACKKAAPPTPATIAGRVKSANGRALGEAKVRLVSPEKVTDVVRETQTSAEGTFTVTDIPAGRYLVRAERDGFSNASVPVELRPGESLSTVLRLEPMQLLEGKVEDREKRPVADAAIFAWPLGGGKAGVIEAAAGADGRFTLAGLAPGPWTVMVEAPGFGTLRLERVDVPGRPLVLRLEGEARSLGGLVVQGPNAAGAADARVTLSGPDLTTPREIRSTDKGIFVFHGLGFGRFLLRADAGEKVSRTVTVVIDESTGWLPPVKLALAPGSMVAGVVLDDLGKPLVGADVELTLVPGDESSETAKADRDGRFSIGPLPPGRYDAWARFPGHAMAAPVDVTVRAEAPTKVELRLSRAAHLTGLAVDEAGRPLAGAHVTVASESAGIQDLSVLAGRLPLAADVANLPPEALAAKGQARSADSDTNGRFKISDLPPGRFRLSASADARLGVERALIRLDAGKNEDVGTLTLPAGIAVRGRLLDENGIALPGARVDLRQMDVAPGGEYTSVAGDDGQFLVYLPRGHFNLVAVAPRRAPMQRAGVVVDSNQVPTDLEFRLERADAVVDGVVRDPMGRPASRARVLAYPLRTGVPDAGAGGATGPTGTEIPPLASSSADKTGRFRLTGVPRQPFLVEVRHNQWPTRLVVATPGQSLFVELPRPGGIEGEVRDRSSGIFVSRYRLEALGPDGRPAVDVRTQGAGFELRGLLPGAWRLRFSADGFISAERLVEVPPGGSRNEISLRNVRVELDRVGANPTAGPTSTTQPTPAGQPGSITAGGALAPP